MRVRLIAIAILGAALLGGTLVGRALIRDGSGGGWSHEAGDVFEAERALTAVFDQGRPNLTFLVQAREGDVDDRAVEAAARDLVDLLEQRPGITDVTSYWTLGRPEWLRSQDGTIGLVTARIPGASEDLASRAAIVDGIVRNADDAVTVTVGGEAVFHADIQRSLRSATWPLVLAGVLSLLAVLVFVRNVVAAALIGATAVLAISLTLIGVWGVAQFREVPVLSVVLGMATAWGLATAGGLLVMSRFVAERHAGAKRRDAVVAAIVTAGRTVAIASVVAAAAGASLWVMPTALLRSTGYTLGIAGLVAGLSTVIGLGVLLAVAGITVVRGETGSEEVAPQRGLDRVSRATLGRPLPAALVLIAVLGPLVFVAANVATGEPTPASLAAASSSRRAAQMVSANFAADEAAAPFVLARNVVDIAGARDLATAYATDLSNIEGVIRVDSAEGSFVDGTPIDVPREVVRQFRGEDAAWFNVPLAGNPKGAAAMATTQAIVDAEAPYRVTVGGPSAREAATAEAVEGRIPYMVGFLVVAIGLLVAWLLRSVNAALRFVVMVIVMTAAAGVVIRFGFADGLLADPLGFSTAGLVPAVGPPIAWALSAALAAALLVFGWGAVREVFDARPDERRSVSIALGATARLHAEAAVLLLIPFVPILLSSWSTAKLIGAAALATGVLTATIGRVVALPAFAGSGVGRLWPVDLEGTPRRVYATTPTVRRLVAEAEGSVPVRRTATPGETATATVAEEDEPPPDDPASAPIGVASAEDEPSVAARTGEPTAPAVPALLLPAADAGPEPEAVEDQEVPPADDEGAPETAAAAEAPAEDEGGRAAPVAPVVAAEPSPEEGSVVAPVERGVPAPDAEPAAGQATDAPEEEPASPEVAAEPPPEEESVAVAGEGEEPATLEVAPVSAPEEPVVAPPGEGQTVAVVADHAQPLEETAGVASGEGSGGSAAVDVASLTASVIAALESGVPFTTEIGEAFVANPANNLSRVMEAILRDASQRGGEEVLVYGHASRDRYRWMVVDSGPSSDSDPDRARTLAEAQRFIRRVGGVVDCRPEGDFTVFVVEIPMAS